jgi:signal transduction histidine kinase
VAGFATFALSSTDLTTLLNGACEAARHRTGVPVAMWDYVEGRLAVQSALGFPGIEDGTFRAEVTQFRPEGQAVTRCQVVVRDSVVAAPISLFGRSNGVLAIVSLAQERLCSQRELANVQKLTELGRMASGIVHEIATPLQFVTNNLMFLQEAFARLSGEEQLDEADKEFLVRETTPAIEQSQFGMQRVQDIVSAMKSLVRSPLEPSEVDCNDVVNGCLLIARHDLAAFSVETKLATDLPAVMGDESALGQAFLNLLTNARHAVDDAREAGRERLVVRVETALDRDNVVVRISDTGLGIPRRVRPRIWEPFFTTKGHGLGTGQGLPLVRTIVADHGGSVDFDTSPDGTTFTVTLPASAN